jgi:uncharacterized membrane protein
MGHVHDRAAPLPPRLRRLLAIAIAPFAIATVVATVVLWPADRHPKSATTLDLGRPADLVDATVEDITPSQCSGSPCVDVYVSVTSGPDKGEAAILGDQTIGPGAPTLKKGDKVVLGRTIDPTDKRVYYYFSDFQRRTPLLFLAILFAVIVIGVARWRGIAALAGLGFTGLVLITFTIPAILEGKSPVAVSLAGGALILFVVLYLAHGINGRTTVALLGTLGSLALTGALAAAFIAATRLTGLSSEESTYVQVLTTRVSGTGLILAGVVIGSLGVLNDVTVTQASAVWEIHTANPTRGALALYRSGMRVGRDHIASVVDTLVLAYAGASLPLLILFTLSNQHLGTVLTGEVVSEEIVRTLVGSIGLVASVPLTTALAAFVVSRSHETHHESHPDSHPAPSTSA